MSICSGYFFTIPKVRKKIGTKLMSEIFSNFRNQLKKNEYTNEVFTFIDATHLISKARKNTINLITKMLVKTNSGLDTRNM